jgi:integrase
MRQGRGIWEADLKRNVATGQIGTIGTVADAYIEDERFNIKAGSTTYRHLCHLLQRAAVQALDRRKERDQGKYDGTHTDPILDPPQGKPEATAQPGESVTALYEQYAIENASKITADTLNQNRKIIHLFAQQFGPAYPASAIDKNAVREWKRALMKWPRKAAEIRQFKGLSFNEVIERNKTLKKPAIEHRTVNKYLSALGGLCDWLVRQGSLNANPVDGLHIPLDRDKKIDRDYKPEQLTAIFKSPVYCGALSDDQDDKPGNHQITDWRRWLPLLALYSGARLGELAQLLIDDVRQQSGQWIIHITREGDGSKTTKTKGSQRVVPLHSELIRCGFLKYHAEMKARGEKWLFPTIERDARAQISGTPSRWYGRYLASLGIKTDKTINFHSYRHGFTTALRRAGYDDDDFGFILGHTKATTTGRYGNIPEGELQRRVTLIEAVKYPGLDLGHLYLSN